MKKRIVSLLLLLVLSALMTVHSVAESTLASSVDEKSSPSFSPSNAGFIAGKGMDTVRVGHDEISIWAYAERQTAPESVRNSLGYAYSVIRGVSSLGELNAQLDAEAQTFDSSFSAAAFVVSDLFCPSLAENKLTLLQSGEERTLQIDLQYAFGEDHRAPIVICQNPVNNTWSVVDCRVAGEPDTISIRLSKLGPVAILTVDRTRMDSREIAGIDKYIWISTLAVMAVIFGAVAFFVVFYRKGRSLSHGAGVGSSETVPLEDNQTDGTP